MIVAIHQPNFFPWLGFFDKIKRSDTFVYLDHVHNTRTQLQTKRVQLLMNGEPRWLTVPLRKHPTGGSVPLNEMEINDDTQFADKHLKTIEHNYGRHPYFDDVFPLIQAFYESSTPLLVERNIRFIESVCNQMGFEAKRIRSSSLDVHTNATALLIEIVNEIGGHTYLSGGGADEYQEDEKFHQAGLELRYQQFEHPVYEQRNSERFVPGLSIVDALMNCGFDGVRELMGF